MVRLLNILLLLLFLKPAVAANQSADNFLAYQSFQCFDPADGLHKLTLKAPTLAGNWQLTFPTTGGTNGYCLTTNGSGVTSWTACQTPITSGNLTDAGTDGITVTGGSGAVLGSGTSLAQHVADASHNGYLSSTDWSTFNGKQDAGNYITALTGDVTASGPGSATATLATVNANVGSFTNSNITVNAKGLITAASNGTAPVTTMGAFGSSPNGNAGTISGNTLTLQPADATNPGGVSTTTQTFAGAKTFSSAPTFSTMTAGSALFAGTSGVLSQDNANYFYDSTNHRIGLGTTAPNYKITQNGGNATATYHQWVNGTTTGTTSTDGLLVGSDASGNAVINQQEALPLIISTSGTEHVRIDSNGNVGIGTSAPGSILSIVTPNGYAGPAGIDLQMLDRGVDTQLLQATAYGNGFNTALAPEFIGRYSRGTPASPTAILANDTLFQISGEGYTGLGFSTRKGYFGFYAAENWAPTTTGTYFALATTAAGGSSRTEKLRVQSDGNIGIGTTAPSVKLDVNGNARIRGLSTAGPVQTDSSGNLSSTATLPIASGGTNGATATAAFDNLSPCSTQGDIAYYNGTHWVCLATGTSGNVLTTNGAAANPSWNTPSGGSGGVQEFTAAGANNWTVPAGVGRITVSGCPAGGGGGGGGGGTGTNSGGGGGAPGVIGTIDLKVTAGDSMVFTLGAGGTAGTAGSSGAGGNGGIGGDTTITLNGTIINKYRAIQQGGNGGGATAGASVSALAGVGGNIGLAGTVGTWSTVSGIPGYGTLNSASTGGGGTDGGGGGSGGLSSYNPGGAGANGSTGSTAGVAGSAGAKCGGGGGGSGSGNSGTTGGAGGVGGDGYILISY